MTKGLVLVVSPLLALMQDQVAKLPACIPSAMLGSSLQPGETQRVLAAVKVSSSADECMLCCLTMCRHSTSLV